MGSLVVHFYVVFNLCNLYSSDSLKWFHYSIPEMSFPSVPS